MTQDLGQIIERIEKLENRLENIEKTISREGRTERGKGRKGAGLSGDLDFALNERAFVKRYGTGKSGPRKFSILLAYLTSGEIDKNVNLGEIRKHWNKMSAKNLLGQFNMFYPNEAKNRGYVDSKEYGVYNLTKEWKNVL